jgi:hypothetical protein
MARRKGGKSGTNPQQNPGSGKNLDSKIQETNAILGEISMPPLNLGKGALNPVEPDQKLEIEKFLSEIRDVAREIRQLRDETKKRSEELARKELAFSRKSDENKKKEDELDKRDNELKSTKSELVNKERELLKRELDARTGFAAQNAAVLADLREEIAELESRRNELQVNIHRVEQKALDNESARISSINEREVKIANMERSLRQAQQRLDAEWKELEGTRTKFQEEARREAAQEIEKLFEDYQRSEDRLKRVYQVLNVKEKELDQCHELSDVLAGRPASELMNELAAYKHQVTDFKRQIDDSEDRQLRAENEELREVRGAQSAQLDKVHRELTEAKAQLHRLLLGVSDKENLEKEQRILVKHNQILSAKLNELGKTVDDLTQSQQSSKPFPQMAWMDTANEKDWIDDCQAIELRWSPTDVPDLEKFALELQRRIAHAENGVPLYFRLEDVQLLIAGLAMSQFHIFQGISGTGKTSLAKAFAKAMGGFCTDIAVQAGWRDRDDLLGHYNAFERRFYERDCLQALYRAGTDSYANRCNIILLDEMNLSRPEQYFAEFLSALEKNNPRDRLISLAENKLPNAPKRLVQGRLIHVPDNVWFVGTANHDETTNEFADKTYDRAHVMTLVRHDKEGHLGDQRSKVAFSHESLMQRFDESIERQRDEVDELLKKLTAGPITKVLLERFDLGWGNRFERQAKRFIPVFMATGGRKEDALDHLLASRVFRRGKVTGRYDVSIDDLTVIEEKLTEVWINWESKPKRSLDLLAEDRRRKERGA